MSEAWQMELLSMWRKRWVVLLVVLLLGAGLWWLLKPGVAPPEEEAFAEAVALATESALGESALDPE